MDKSKIIEQNRQISDEKLAYLPVRRYQSKKKKVQTRSGLGNKFQSRKQRYEKLFKLSARIGIIQQLPIPDQPIPVTKSPKESPKKPPASPQKAINTDDSLSKVEREEKQPQHNKKTLSKRELKKQKKIRRKEKRQNKLNASAIAAGTNTSKTEKRESEQKKSEKHEKKAKKREIQSTKSNKDSKSTSTTKEKTPKDKKRQQKQKQDDVAVQSIKELITKSGGSPTFPKPKSPIKQVTQAKVLTTIPPASQKASPPAKPNLQAKSNGKVLSEIPQSKQMKKKEKEKEKSEEVQTAEFIEEEKKREFVRNIFFLNEDSLLGKRKQKKLEKRKARKLQKQFAKQHIQSAELSAHGELPVPDTKVLDTSSNNSIHFLENLIQNVTPKGSTVANQPTPTLTSPLRELMLKKKIGKADSDIEMESEESEESDSSESSEESSSSKDPDMDYENMITSINLCSSSEEDVRSEEEDLSDFVVPDENSLSLEDEESIKIAPIKFSRSPTLDSATKRDDTNEEVDSEDAPYSAHDLLYNCDGSSSDLDNHEKIDETTQPTQNAESAQNTAAEAKKHEQVINIRSNENENGFHKASQEPINLDLSPKQSESSSDSFGKNMTTVICSISDSEEDVIMCSDDAANNATSRFVSSRLESSESTSSDGLKEIIPPSTDKLGSASEHSDDIQILIPNQPVNLKRLVKSS